MARRKRKPPRAPRCRDCRDVLLEGERYYRGLCDFCRSKRATARHAATGARLLDKAKDAGTVDRDGQPYRVVVLPPKRGSGRRMRRPAR